MCVCALYLTGVDASFADAKYSAAELKKMSTFLSNFTEVGMRDFDVSTITRDALIHFGVQHNNINNFKSRVVQCKINGCPHGSLAIDAKYVDETIKKYFAKNFKDHGSVKPDYDYDKEYLYYFDKKQYHYEGADGEAVVYARVEKVSKNASGQIVMTGELYNAEDKSDKRGSFKALAKPHKYNGKDTWAILSLKTLDE